MQFPGLCKSGQEVTTALTRRSHDAVPLACFLTFRPSLSRDCALYEYVSKFTAVFKPSKSYLSSLWSAGFHTDLLIRLLVGEPALRELSPSPLFNRNYINCKRYKKHLEKNHRSQGLNK